MYDEVTCAGATMENMQAEAQAETGGDVLICGHVRQRDMEECFSVKDGQALLSLPKSLMISAHTGRCRYRRKAQHSSYHFSNDTWVVLL